MPEPNVTSPKRRPVDALFGDAPETTTVPPSRERVENVPSAAPKIMPSERGSMGSVRADAKPAPNYLVEPARPPTILRPPPPEFPPDWRAFAPPETATRVQPGEEAAQTESSITPPPSPIEMVAPASTIHSGPIATAEIRAAADESAPASVATVEMKGTETMEYVRVAEDYRELAGFVDLLYQQVSEEASESPRVSEQCLALLHAAREMLEKNDYVGAEYKAEQVKARLLRSRASTMAAGSFGVRALWGWYVFIGLVALVVIVSPFFLRLVPGIVPLIRAVALGALGGVMGGLWNLTSYLHSRDYDPAYAPDYWASPIKGALVGGFIFFLSALGLVAAPGALGTETFLGTLHSTHFLMYFLALVSGIAQDYIFEFVRGVFAAIFRAPTRALKGDRP